ncbi:hypothetical protein B0T09DRAFT_373905 [Sordaria sp. MPI-SDFR-AT-0083]|nr:hypothetical protein B0T09DRAFT_373905 [Sordaria sp. MPI-SDFR-AT-0083]
MSPSELLRRRHSPHQQITDRDEDHQEDSGSDNDRDEGDDGDDVEDQSANDHGNDNEEEGKSKGKNGPPFFGPSLSGVWYHPNPQDIPNVESTYEQSQPAGKISSFTGSISTTELPFGNAPESPSWVSSQEHTATADPLQRVTVSPMADDGKRSISFITGLTSLEDQSDEAMPDSTSDVPYHDSTANTMIVTVSPTPETTSTEISTSFSSTPPMTTSTDSETDTVPTTPPFKTTNAAGSNKSPTQESAAEATTEINSSGSKGGPAPQHSDGNGYTKDPHIPATTATRTMGEVTITTVDGTVGSELETLATEPGLAITTTSLPSISPTSSTSQVDGAISFEGEKKTSSGGDGPNKGAIIGGLIAGLVVVSAILFFLWRRRKTSRKRHSASSTSHLLTSKNAGKKLSDKDCYPFDDSSSSSGNTVGRTSPWPIKGAATATATTCNSVRQQPVSGAGTGATCSRPGHNPVSPISPGGGDAASLDGLSSLSRGSSFSYASDDYSCRGSAASNTGSMYQATALAYPAPGQVTPVMMPGAGYPATARIVNLSPKPQKPEMVMVRNSNRNSSTAELKKGAGAGQWDNEACGCRDSRVSTLTSTAGQWDKESCGCDGSKGATVTEVVSPPPMAAKALYEALGGSGPGPGPGPVSRPSSSRPVTWMKQPSPLSTARNSAASSTAFVPSPIGGTPMPGG